MGEGGCGVEGLNGGKKDHKPQREGLGEGPLLRIPSIILEGRIGGDHGDNITTYVFMLL